MIWIWYHVKYHMMWHCDSCHHITISLWYRMHMWINDVIWSRLWYHIIKSLCAQFAPPPPPATQAAVASLRRFLVVEVHTRLCRQGLALAGINPGPLRLSDGHHPGAAPAIAPHPEVHLVKPASVAPVQSELRAGWGADAQNERGAPNHVGQSRGRAGAGCWLRHRASMGTPACGMILSCVCWLSSMGSIVLKYTRDTSVWELLYPGSCKSKSVLTL